MTSTEDRKKVDEIWNLVEHEHIAVLFSITKDGSLDSIPMGVRPQRFRRNALVSNFQGQPETA